MSRGAPGGRSAAAAKNFASYKNPRNLLCVQINP